MFQHPPWNSPEKHGKRKGTANVSVSTLEFPYKHGKRKGKVNVLVSTLEFLRIKKDSECFGIHPGILQN